jgi:eukaryotic-like serine/threonine-protein kinase
MADDSADRWRIASPIFDEAVRLPREQRDAFLDSACGGDADLKAEVAKLLDFADRTHDFLEQPLHSQAGEFLRRAMEEIPEDASGGSSSEAAEASTLTSSSTSNSHPERIGPYRLLQKLGEGGMGEVWLAEQTEPVRRKVALKVIKAGMDTRQVIARFEAERQALALMDHPAIAKVYEAGETPRGLPYFAMEYVAGEPITSYCDRHLLTMPERLQLFSRVCEGVQHAHQKGVIHRDLKPSNVLVAIQDGGAVPKIIDFGVAKAIAQRLTERTMFTELGVLIGTPEYMSPEQAEMTGLDVDTRTDVYALGVMLYELLTGALPFESRDLRQAGYDEIRRRIREVDPPRPSTRISTMGDASAESARNRKTDPGKLASQLRGDLDWIVMKALEKDRTRRYGTPSEVASDLTRHLKHEPVVAGPPSAWYRSKKFVRRHRFGVAMATLGVAGLVAFGLVMALQARTIARERDRAERVSEFLVSLFKVSDPSEARGNSITAREVLDRGADQIGRELEKEPLVQAQMMQTMGRVYLNLGLAKKAEPLFARCVELRTDLLGPESLDTLKARRLNYRAWDHLGRYKEVEAALVPLLATDRRVLGENDPETLSAMSDLGVSYERLEMFEKAGAFYKDSLERRRRVLGLDDPDTIWSTNNLASNLEDTGKPEDSARLFHEVTMARERVLGADHPDTLQSMTNEARLLNRTHHTAEAEDLLRKAIDGKTRVLGSEHPSTLVSKSELIEVLVSEKKYDDASALYHEVLETRLRIGPADTPAVLSLKTNMGVYFMMMGRPADARKVYQEVYQTALASRGSGDSYTGGAAYGLATVASREGKRVEAIQWVRVTLESAPGNVNYMLDDSDLQPLKGDPEFERLLADARARDRARQAGPGP